MTIVATAPARALWRAEKTVTRSGHHLRPHTPSPVSAGFVAPPVPTHIAFRPEALAASMARALTLRHAPDAMLERWARMQLLEVEYLVQDGAAFALAPEVTALADAERSGFAGRVGAGVTDLLMNTLGYTWRDNAVCLSASLEPHADFIYGGGAVSAHGVVLAEAHGSFAQAVTDGRMRCESSAKYRRQVKPHIGSVCPHGKAVHGYSVAFGSHPTTHDTFLHVTETKITNSRKKAAPPAAAARGLAPVATSLALASHRSNFLLMGASRIVAWIDWLRNGGPPPADDLVAPFVTVQQGGQRFWVALEALLPFVRPWTRPDEGPFWAWEDFERLLEARRIGLDNVFAMEEWAANSFLSTLSAMIDGGREQMPATLELPVIALSGLFTDPERPGHDDGARYPVAQFRDGLALLGRLPRIERPGSRIWSPRQGFG
ncbi:hypothetical protein [Nitrobacter sp. TKz-YC01]|uniref:hypothetical protein n=1 Tax=Nitrobacter sp. TKz-YC01 TaxID=3398703 RepID=UPI003A0FE60D